MMLQHAVGGACAGPATSRQPMRWGACGPITTALAPAAQAAGQHARPPHDQQHRRQRLRCRVPAAAAAAGGGGGGGAAPVEPAPMRAQQRARASANSGPAAYSPVRVLQGLELAALSLAAACQAVALVSAAGRHLQREAQWAAADRTQGGQQQQQQQLVAAAQPHAPAGYAQASSSSGVLQLATNGALVLGLLCGAALRYLQPRGPPAPGGGGGGRAAATPSAEAAVRLAAVEVASQRAAAQLDASARQMEKLQARVRLATNDARAPLRAVQASSAQHAAALLQLSEQQVALQRQLEGGQELMAALQGVAAKQFKVSAEALQQLKQGQAQLGASSSKAIAGLQQQHAKLQQQLHRHQQQLVALEAAAAAVRWVQLQEHTGPGGRDGTQQQPPDPWRSAGDGAVLDTARAGAPAAHANGHSSSSSSSGSSSSGSSSSGGSSSGSSSGGSSYSVMSSGNGAASHAPVHGGKCAQAGGERSDGGKQDAVSGAPAGAEHAGATGSA